MTTPAAPHPRRRSGSKLVDDASFPIQRATAELFGSTGAHLLHQLDYYLQEVVADELRDGTEPDREHRWLLASYKDWREVLTWTSRGTILRAVKVLERKGAILTVHVAGAKSAKWYTIDYPRLAELIAAKGSPPPVPKGPMRRLLNLRTRPPEVPPPTRPVTPRERALCALRPAQSARSGLRKMRTRS